MEATPTLAPSPQVPKGKHPNGTLAATALASIVALMRKGELRPGDVINEADLAKRFGMSRGPVREAVQQLQGRKLVIREAYQRARVVQLEFEQVREIYELREALEGMACRLATRRMSDDDLRSLVKAVEGARKPEDYSFVYTDSNFNFHEAVIGACGNARIQEVLSGGIYDMVRLYRWTHNIRPARRGPMTRDHWQISRAMLARDEDLAESLMRAHVQHAMQMLESGNR